MKKRTLFVLMFIAFIDSLGCGLVYPLFSYFLFDPKWHFVPEGTPETVRGLWLGLLLSAMPLTQVLFSPFMGKLSDKYGRRLVLIPCQIFGVVQYLVAALGVYTNSLALLILARIGLGVSVASYAVVNASVADSTEKDTKAKSFAWLGMAFGLGFALGPFFGGGLACSTWFWDESFVRPFFGASIFAFINFSCTYFWLPETFIPKTEAVKKAETFIDKFKGLFKIESKLLFLLCAVFLYCFGWSFYYELIPVWWVTTLHFSTSTVGLLFAFGALWYFIGCAFLVEHVLRLLQPFITLRYALFLLSLCIWSVFWINTSSVFWVFMPLQNVLAALVFPIAASIASEIASHDDQGRVLGLFGAAESLGFGMSPIVAGSTLGVHLLMPVLIGGGSIFAAGVITYLVYKRSLKSDFVEKRLVVDETVDVI